MGSRFADLLLDAQIRDDLERNVMGVVEPDEPTPTSHFLWRERLQREGHKEFTAAECRHIRLALGMEPFASHAAARLVDQRSGRA